MKSPRTPLERRHGGGGAASRRDHRPHTSFSITGAIVETAQRLAAAGFAVFPCGADKAPVIRTGFKAATRDPVVAVELFRRSDAVLIGIATGAASGVAVLDLDGAPGLAWGEQNAGRLPQTVVVQTRRGGLHHWFSVDTDAPPCSAGRIALGVDTRGRAGYAIAWEPCALLAGRASMAPWPVWLTQALQPPPAPPSPPVNIPTGTAALRLLARALARVRSAPKPGEGAAGRRHDTLRAAARLVGGVVAIGLLDEVAARRELVAAGIAAGLPDAEAQAAVAWGLADGARHPLDWRRGAR